MKNNLVKQKTCFWEMKFASAKNKQKKLTYFCFDQEKNELSDKGNCYMCIRTASL